MTAEPPHERTPSESRVTANGVELAVFDWPGEGAPILFLHATGFHARCWDEVIRHLPGRRCIAVDLRGHGRSAKPAPPYGWYTMALDVAELVRMLDPRGALGVGHSMGGFELTAVAAKVPEAFAGLLLLDPTIGPRGLYTRPQSPGPVHFSAKRRDAWPSPEAMVARFRDRPPYDLWDPAVLRDYCTYGLLPAPSGDGYVLACPPAVEAAVYAGRIGYDIYEAVDAIDIPVRVLRARPRDAAAAPGSPAAFSSSPTDPDLAAQFRRGEDLSLPHLTHFIPMQDPSLVARHIEEMAGRTAPGLSATPSTLAVEGDYG